jgi:hypothetical protein
LQSFEIAQQFRATKEADAITSHAKSLRAASTKALQPFAIAQQFRATKEADAMTSHAKSLRAASAKALQPFAIAQYFGATARDDAFTSHTKSFCKLGEGPSGMFEVSVDVGHRVELGAAVFGQAYRSAGRGGRRRWRWAPRPWQVVVPAVSLLMGGRLGVQVQACAERAVFFGGIETERRFRFGCRWNVDFTARILTVRLGRIHALFGKLYVRAVPTEVAVHEPNAHTEGYASASGVVT